MVLCYKTRNLEYKSINWEIYFQIKAAKIFGTHNEQRRPREFNTQSTHSLATLFFGGGYLKIAIIIRIGRN